MKFSSVNITNCIGETKFLNTKLHSTGNLQTRQFSSLFMLNKWEYLKNRPIFHYIISNSE